MMYIIQKEKFQDQIFKISNEMSKKLKENTHQLRKFIIITLCYLIKFSKFEI